MKTIALVALLVAAACSKKTADCEPTISKGVDDLTATVTTRAPSPQTRERMTNALGKLKATLITRCTEDHWSPDAVSCFANIPNMKGLQDCEAKLTDEQRKKVEAERRSLMRGGGGPRMPDLPGHPQSLSPSGSSAPGEGAALGSAADPGAISPPPAPPIPAAPAPGSPASPPATPPAPAAPAPGSTPPPPATPPAPAASKPK